MNHELKVGDIVGSRYKIAAFVGEGGMQLVYSAFDQVLERTVALKTPKNASAKKRFERSAIVAARVNHPNVAKTFDYFEENGSQYLIEEFVVGGDLDKAVLLQMSCVDPFHAAKIFHHLAKGLAASHHVGVVHRDLKPTNVMVTGGLQIEAIKITDFGIAKMADEELTEAALGGSESITASQTAVGALPYMAPEAIEDPKSVSYPADIWSIGAMMYEVLTGQKPFGTGLPAVKRIIDASLPPTPTFLSRNPQFTPLAKELMALIAKCLAKESALRPSADELVKECGLLCYTSTTRYIGTVRTIMYSAWGFILQIGGGDVFFHLTSVYGDPVGVDDRVLFSKFPGGGAWRAHPVVALRPPPVS